jgi:hypothetical protein
MDLSLIGIRVPIGLNWAQGKIFYGWSASFMVSLGTCSLMSPEYRVVKGRMHEGRNPTIPRFDSRGC